MFGGTLSNLESPEHTLNPDYKSERFFSTQLVLNVRKVKSNMAAFCKDILSGPRPLFYLVLVLFYFLLIDYWYHLSVVKKRSDYVS